MRRRTWNRDAVITAIRADVWRYLSQSASASDIELEAAHLL
jgi:hypothetical protein